jgi:hypothetical protein
VAERSQDLRIGDRLQHPRARPIVGDDRAQAILGDGDDELDGGGGPDVTRGVAPGV